MKPWFSFLKWSYKFFGAVDVDFSHENIIFSTVSLAYVRTSNRIINTLTPKPAVTGHATSILVGRISAGCCSKRREKVVGRVVIKETFKEEMKGLPLISPTTRSEEKRGKVAYESIPQIN
ncbi:hypothetical protein AVEN_57180-1 [Araneus ventricosus]|uniref:Uncharacterized protein n=1 Tax=Araneus ventricosus TaxID=182803 RepID=A0A4Y2K471_ARAVE|nr:hypothetical protein AVEN_57180-1 [Araneus ventricosus]